jgi:hypothetical protein
MTRPTVSSKVLGARRVHGRLVEVETIASRWLRCVIPMALMVRKAARAHVAIMVIVAGPCTSKSAFGYKWHKRDEEGTHTLGSLSPVVETRMLLARAGEDRVVGVCFDVLLQVLGALEAFAAKLALVRFERDMYSDVRGDVIALDGGCATRIPLAGKAQIIGALATNVAFANVFLGQECQ